VGPGEHLTPQQFHLEIENIVSSCDDNDQISDSHISDGESTTAVTKAPEMVLLDVRNFYESAIGRFVAPSKAEGAIRVIDPQTRQVTFYVLPYVLIRIITASV
jgi:predicted sulfurtransferase